MPSVSAKDCITRARRRDRRFRARRRRSVALTGALAFALALGAAVSVSSFAGVELASATVQRARSLADLLGSRSPGERLQGQLSNTKHKPRVLAEREAPASIPQPPRNLAEVLAPADAEVASFPTVLSTDMPELALQAPPGGALFLLPSGGGGGGGGGGTTPGGGGTPGGPGGPSEQPPVQPQQPPAVPEPGTWMTMILGFGLAGFAFRRRRAAVALARYAVAFPETISTSSPTLTESNSLAAKSAGTPMHPCVAKP